MKQLNSEEMKEQKNEDVFFILSFFHFFIFYYSPSALSQM